MGAELRLQNPGARSGHLLDTLIQLAVDADRGGGIFAFATADGINAVLHDDSFERLLDHEFQLVVGVDSVTNVRAISALIDADAAFRGLNARVLIHEESVLFHPKLCWFGKDDELQLVVGSGNLTVRGLTENWEAFTIVELTGGSATAAEGQLSAWLSEHEDLLAAPADSRVRERAALNTGREHDLKHPRRHRTEEAPPPSAEVLVAEAPKSGDRPSQVNFHKEHYEGFFGAQAGTQNRVILRNVSQDGTVGEVEDRKSSSRRSRNFSLELAGFHDAYRVEGEPPFIGVYARLPQGTFLYRRISPGEDGYEAMAGLLVDRWTGPEGRMRQVVASLSDVQGIWPDCPLVNAEVPST